MPPALAATRVFSDPDTGFHPEAYLLAAADGTAAETLVSSNSFSASGIAGGIKSAIGTTSAVPPLAACEQLRPDQRAKPLSREFLAGYRQRWQPACLSPTPTPRSRPDGSSAAARELECRADREAQAMADQPLEMIVPLPKRPATGSLEQ